MTAILRRYGVFLAPAALQVLFVTLRLTGVTSWPWAWVLVPAWLAAGLCLLVIGVLFWGLWCWGQNTLGSRH